MRVVCVNTAVIGSGAAGYNAACRLKQFGCEDTVLLTEGVCKGTSRNTGSDKQTYYKLGMAGDSADSVHDMAADLFDGGCVDGDNALAEAALSARSFLHLCERGVPFPTNSYGEYVGYKTDHDPRARATSVGPLTSRDMTVALEREAQERGVRVLDDLLVTCVLTERQAVRGVTAINSAGELSVFCCKNVIFATGGPAGIYNDSVYPLNHNGASGVLFAAGAHGQNLTEWQYGLASVAPRWNVSGTYMQVLPRFVSVDERGREHDFLSEYFKNRSECLSMVFLKGYQWPFDSRRVLNGSSVIDLLVYRETVLRERRVFLDFRRNPFDEPIDFSALNPDARDYLEKAGACFGTPLERLLHMNRPAFELYKSKGLDLEKEMLEIALCAQHNNGGIAVDAWWQSSIDGLFVCGEAAGTHGIYRPGGSALNAGQCGSLRAAQYIAARRGGSAPQWLPESEIEQKISQELEFCRCMLRNPDNINEKTLSARVRMSRAGGAIRRERELADALSETQEELSTLAARCGVSGKKERLQDAFRLRDILTCQCAYLTAMLDYVRRGFSTRGSALYYDPHGSLCIESEERFRFSHDGGANNGMIQEVHLKNGSWKTLLRQVRPLPSGGGFFENVWREFRENGGIE